MIIYCDAWDGAKDVWKAQRLEVRRDDVKETGFTVVIDAGSEPSIRLTAADAGKLLVAISEVFEGKK